MESKQNTQPACIWSKTNTLKLRVYIQASASCDKVIGLYGNCIKIRLTAKPLDGEANKHLIKYLAKCFQIKKNQIKILRGKTSRSKILKIKNVSNIPDKFCCN